ncbi:DNA-formamidopyrimidine glycosylase [Oceanobacillus oncorhynchi]|uniref:DNA-formamidopyrimidine glycosylase n=1 Tax=Oceanobacillus oncorhynchi TaxID=545501 RepID=UPI0021168210|nr:DNA-formamidopyrimidine glycosylase [Oceanobacillus oncorhynchi]UUI38309.1 DNA-formamidopyrimidine glycosylase [Oceanobacillus oncorhynchi]
MPELPEVETIKETLKLLVQGKTIEKADVLWANIIKQPDDAEIFKHLLEGQTFQQIKRKGKFLLFYLDEYVLVSHLRMEGKYRLHQPGEEIEKHTHVVFHLKNGETLRYNDVRKFGTMHLLAKGSEFTQAPLAALGPEPFEEAFTTDYFYEKLKKSSRFIKTALLDQNLVTGLGNIYVDETLFRSGIHPLTKCNELTKKEASVIRSAAIETLQEALKAGGTTIRSYVDSQGNMGMFQQVLYVYGQDKKPCKTCGEEIIKMKVGGRGTHLCLHCQPQKKVNVL